MTTQTLSHQPVQFQGPAGQLSGTLVLPDHPGPHPAVVCVHGSGPETADSSLPRARDLARLGVATLVYDKRGTGMSEGDWTGATYQELAEDAVAAVHFLQTHPHIRKEAIGLHGTSQGGWVAPMAAATSAEVRFLVLVSGSTLSPSRQELYRMEAQMRAAGCPEEDIQEVLVMYRLFNRTARQNQPIETIMALYPLIQDRRFFGFGAELPPLPMLQNIWRQWKADLDLDILPVFRGLQVPILALFGEKDTYVPAHESRQALEEACLQGDLTCHTYPDGTHFLTHASTHQPFLDVPERMARWVLAKMG